MRSLRPHQDQNSKVALIVIDINHFQACQRYAGPPYRRCVAAPSSERLNSLDPQRYVASRFGGDEFVIFVFNLHDSSEVNGMMEHIISAVTGVYDLDGAQVDIDNSAGVAIEDIDKCDVGHMHIKADLAPL